MKVTYVVVSSESDYYRIIYRCEDGEMVEYIADDKGEESEYMHPFEGKFKWIPNALQRAYELGFKHGKESK